jgi:hypothetical protein
MRLLIPRVVCNWEYATHVKPNFSNMKANNSGPGRQFSCQESAPYWAEAFSAFGLVPFAVEPMFLNLTGHHYVDGAFVQEHMDPAPPGFVHTRCNLMIKKPLYGGDPILDGEVVPVAAGDLWLCLASLEKHASTPTSGGDRVIFSFGGLVPVAQILKIVDYG